MFRRNCGASPWGVTTDVNIVSVWVSAWKTARSFGVTIDAPSISSLWIRSCRREQVGERLTPTKARVRVVAGPNGSKGRIRERLRWLEEQLVQILTAFVSSILTAT